MKRIFVHGLGQTPASWEKILAQLGGAETTCLALAELIAAGTADYDRLYRAFSMLCDQAEGTVDLCGLSLGGVLALNYAIEHPKKVHSLVLIGAQYKTPKTLLRLQNLLFRLMPRSMFEETGLGKKDFLQLCASMMKLDFSASLDRVACPVLVVCGEKDSLNIKASQELAAAIDRAQLRIIEGAGHEVNQEAPEKLAKVLQDFYAQIS